MRGSLGSSRLPPKGGAYVNILDPHDHGISGPNNLCMLLLRDHYPAPCGARNPRVLKYTPVPPLRPTLATGLSQQTMKRCRLTRPLTTLPSGMAGERRGHCFLSGHGDPNWMHFSFLPA